MSDSDDLYDDAIAADYATHVGSDPKAFLGHGWAFPIAISGGRIAAAEYEEDIRQAIRINTTTIALARHRVEQALILWEPRIDHIGVEVRAEPKQGILRIEVRYRVRTTNTFYNLVYPFYAQEGRSVGLALGPTKKLMADIRHGFDLPPCVRESA